MSQLASSPDDGNDDNDYCGDGYGDDENGYGDGDDYGDDDGTTGQVVE